jgi:hypothetical protein
MIFLKTIPYEDQMNKIQQIMREINKGRVVFKEKYDPTPLGLIDECITSNKECNIYQDLCDLINDKKCNIILPKYNLITGKENELTYYSKIADEIIRNKRISFLILNSTSFVSFSEINFNINDNEIILLKSLLKTYFNKPLIKIPKNKYINHTTYDDAQSMKEYKKDTHEYINNIKDDAIFNISFCNTTFPTELKSVWQKTFIEGTNEIIYNSNEIYCTYQPLIDLYANKYKTILTLQTIKNDLYEEYQKYTQIYYNKLIQINGKEGNNVIINKILDHQISLNTAIMINGYKLVIFDLWLLAIRYKLPIIIFANRKLAETHSTTPFLKLYGGINDNYALIIINKGPQYKLITHDSIDETGVVNSDSYNYFFKIDYIISNKSINKIKKHIESTLNSEDVINNFLEKYDTTS